MNLLKIHLFILFLLSLTIGSIFNPSFSDDTTLIEIPFNDWVNICKDDVSPCYFSNPTNEYDNNATVIYYSWTTLNAKPSIAIERGIALFPGQKDSRASGFDGFLWVRYSPTSQKLVEIAVTETP